MSSPHHTLGQRGEQVARDYLLARGYAILAANWRCVYGELDIVAQQGETIVFVEVRTRRAGADSALESLTPAKARKLERAMRVYLAQHDLGDAPCRLDALAIAFTGDGTPHIEHVEDAFGW